jgi:hypothetical protein
MPGKSLPSTTGPIPAEAASQIGGDHNRGWRLGQNNAASTDE